MTTVLGSQGIWCLMQSLDESVSLMHKNGVENTHVDSMSYERFLLYNRSLEQDLYEEFS